MLSPEPHQCEHCFPSEDHNHRFRPFLRACSICGLTFQSDDLVTWEPYLGVDGEHVIDTEWFEQNCN